MALSQTFSIGRDPHADIPIADDSVSRLHAQVSVIGPDEIFLTDCGSTNGTWRMAPGGAEAIGQAKVRGHERVKFGSVEIHASDLMEAIQTTKGARNAPPPPPKPQAAIPLPRSERLVRCTCGAVRAARDNCVLCGDL